MEWMYRKYSGVTQVQFILGIQFHAPQTRERDNAPQPYPPQWQSEKPTTSSLAMTTKMRTLTSLSLINLLNRKKRESPILERCVSYNTLGLALTIPQKGKAAVKDDNSDGEAEGSLPKKKPKTVKVHLHPASAP